MWQCFINTKWGIFTNSLEDAYYTNVKLSDQDNTHIPAALQRRWLKQTLKKKNNFFNHLFWTYPSNNPQTIHRELFTPCLDKIVKELRQISPKSKWMRSKQINGEMFDFTKEMQVKTTVGYDCHLPNEQRCFLFCFFFNCTTKLVKMWLQWPFYNMGRSVKC